MIENFSNPETELLFATGKSRRLPPDILRRAVMRLAQLDATVEIEDLRQPPSNRLERLSGDLAGKWSIRINDRWRVCFRFDRGNAQDVEIIDYHLRKSTMKAPLNGLPAIHPGKFLREILDDMALTQVAFADAIGVSPMRVSHVLKGDRPVTAELALRLGQAFGQSPQYWLNLQADYDLKIARTTFEDSLSHVQKFAVA